MTTSNQDLKGVLFGMGNPLLDMCIVDEKQELLGKYELNANDAILAEEKHLPLYDEIVKRGDLTYIAGGSSQNALRGAQRFLPPNSTVYVGCVGNDGTANKLREAAEEDGLEVNYLVDKETPTGVCALLISGVNRSMVTNLQAANKYQVSHLKEKDVERQLARARYYYIEGFFLTVSPPTIQEVAEHAANENKVFAMNLSSPFLCKEFRKPMDASAPYWDLIFGNEAEAAEWAKWDSSEAADPEETDLKVIALRLANLPKKNTKRKRLAIITQGSGSTLVATQGQVHPEDVQVFPVPLVPVEEINDTNGAGDAFVGGFLSQQILGGSIEDSVNIGHALAGQVIRLSGAKYPDRGKLNDESAIENAKKTGTF